MPVFIFLNLFFLKGKGVFGKHTLSITDEGLLEETEVNTSLQKWNGILKTAQTKRYYYIHASENAAHLVPKSRLLEGDIQQLIQEVETRARLAKETRA